MRNGDGVLAADGLFSCACFGFETVADFTLSWNERFEAIRSGFEMVCAKAKNAGVFVLPREVPATNADRDGKAVLKRAS